MRVDLVVHIFAGMIGIVSGFVALYVVKGATVHRKSGMVFVYAMLVMSLMGAGIAAIRNVAPQSNIPAGLLTAYLVITGLVTMRAPGEWSRRWDVGLMLLALGLGLTNFTLGIRAILDPNPKYHWTIIPFSIFGTIALLAAAGDVRVLRRGALRGTPKLARHLWRMCFALFIATSSFFLGQAKVFPKAIRIPGLLALPVLAVLVTMLYWMWRVRSKRGYRVVQRESGASSGMRRTADGMVRGAAPRTIL